MCCPTHKQPPLCADATLARRVNLRVNLQPRSGQATAPTLPAPSPAGAIGSALVPAQFPPAPAAADLATDHGTMRLHQSILSWSAAGRAAAHTNHAHALKIAAGAVGQLGLVFLGTVKRCHATVVVTPSRPIRLRQAFLLQVIRQRFRFSTPEPNAAKLGFELKDQES